MNRADGGDRTVGRRTFLAGAVAGAIAIVEPAAVRGYPANSAMELGLIGCGGRGNWIADLFRADGGYRLAACADYFPDRAEATGARLAIESSRRHGNLSGYRKVLDGKVDAVVIESPPYFHPEQASRAVEAGKHVFLAKPIAVDAPGCLEIAEAGKRATASRLVFLVDFQTRASPLFREALRRVRAGDIGPLVLVDAFYPWAGGGRGTPPAGEERLRNWYYVLPLSARARARNPSKAERRAELLFAEEADPPPHRPRHGASSSSPPDGRRGPIEPVDRLNFVARRDDFWI